MRNRRLLNAAFLIVTGFCINVFAYVQTFRDVAPHLDPLPPAFENKKGNLVYCAFEENVIHPWELLVNCEGFIDWIDRGYYGDGSRSPEIKELIYELRRPGMGNRLFSAPIRLTAHTRVSLKTIDSLSRDQYRAFEAETLARVGVQKQPGDQLLIIGFGSEQVRLRPIGIPSVLLTSPIPSFECQYFPIRYRQLDFAQHSIILSDIRCLSSGVEETHKNVLCIAASAETDSMVARRCLEQSRQSPLRTRLILKPGKRAEDCIVANVMHDQLSQCYNVEFEGAISPLTPTTRNR